jgi:hypothetical protein
MPYTRLSITALPGRNYAGFVAKAFAISPKGAGEITTLSVTATPGRKYQIGGRQVGAGFTELSVTATPGAKHSFAPKGATVVVPHEGEFTQLSVIALPGGRHVFLAKAEAPIVEPPIEPPVILPGGGVVSGADDLHMEYSERKRELLLREDEEIVEIISIIVSSGILEE